MKRLLTIILAFTVVTVLMGCGKTKPIKHQQTAQDCMNMGDSASKATCLIKLAETKCSAKADESARALLAQASSCCDDIADPNEKSGLFNQIAEIYGKLGDDFGQREALRKAGIAVAAVDDPEKKAQAFVDMAKAQAASKDFGNAFKTVEQACSSVQDSFSPDSKVNIFLTAAQVYHDGEADEQFEAMIAKVREVADGLTKDARKAAEIYGDIGCIYYAADKKDKGKEAFDKAKEILTNESDLENKGFGFVVVAEMAIKAGDKDIANEFLTAAQKVVKPLTKDKSDRGSELDKACDQLKNKLT